MKPIAIDDIKVMNLGLGRSIYSPAQLEEFARFQESQGTRCAFLAESAERAYNSRAGGQWGSGLSHLATESLIDVVGYHLVPMYRVIGPTAADPQDAARHHDPGDQDCEDPGLRMVDEWSLLGNPVLGGSGACAVGDGQGPHHQQDSHLPDDRGGCMTRDGRLQGAEDDHRRGGRAIGSQDAAQ